MRLRQSFGPAAILVSCLCAASCAELSTVARDAPAAASAAATICQNLVPAAEATANALASGNAASQVRSTEVDYIDPACEAVTLTASAVDSGWLANVVANLTSTAATGQPGAAPAGQASPK